MPLDDSTLRRFSELLSEPSAGGSRLSKLQVEDVLALLILMAKVSAESLPAPFVQALAHFGARLKDAAPSPGLSLQAQIDTYFLRNPPHPELLELLRSALGAASGLERKDYDPTALLPTKFRG